MVLSEGMVGMLENTFLNVKNRSKNIEANVDLKGNDRGIILCQGGKFGGWAL
jgi:arylsulfatase